MPNHGQLHRSARTTQGASMGLRSHRCYWVHWHRPHMLAVNQYCRSTYRPSRSRHPAGTHLKSSRHSIQPSPHARPHECRLFDPHRRCNRWRLLDRPDDLSRVVLHFHSEVPADRAHPQDLPRQYEPFARGHLKDVPIACIWTPKRSLRLNQLMGAAESAS